MLITSLCELHSKSEIRFDVVNINCTEYTTSEMRAHTPAFGRINYLYPHTYCISSACTVYPTLRGFH